MRCLKCEEVLSLCQCQTSMTNLPAYLAWCRARIKYLESLLGDIPDEA
jgi:hypothetical protein